MLKRFCDPPLRLLRQSLNWLAAYPRWAHQQAMGYRMNLLKNGIRGNFIRMRADRYGEFTENPTLPEEPTFRLRSHSQLSKIISKQQRASWSFVDGRMWHFHEMTSEEFEQSDSSVCPRNSEPSPRAPCPEGRAKACRDLVSSSLRINSPFELKDVVTIHAYLWYLCFAVRQSIPKVGEECRPYSLPPCLLLLVKLGTGGARQEMTKICLIPAIP
jgi:hypothetical protein